MPEWLSVALSYIFGFFNQYPTKIFLIEILFCVKKQRRKYFWFRIIPLSLFFLIVWPYVIGYQMHILKIGNWFVLSFIFQYLFSIFLVWFCFDMTWQQTLFYCSSAYAIEHSCNALFTMMRLGCLKEMEPLLRTGIHTIILICYYLLFYFVIVRRLVRFDISYIKAPFVWGISITTVLVTNVLSQLMAYVGNDIYHNLYDFVLSVFLVASQFAFYKLSELRMANDTMKIMLRLNEEQYKAYKNNIDQINHKCHDLKHQIAALRQMNKSEHIEGYLKSLEQNVSIYDSTIKTGNSAMDVILTEKKFECDKKQINLSFFSNGIDLSFISEVDLFILFGNILDNAIESVEKIEDREKRIITVRMLKRGDMVSLHCDNPCEKEIRFADELPITTKPDKSYHGYGMRSIREIVQKYGGTMNIISKNHVFTLNILIPEKSQTMKENIS